MTMKTTTAIVLIFGGIGISLLSQQRSSTEPSYKTDIAPAPPAEIAAARSKMDPALSEALDRVIGASWNAFDRESAQAHVQFVSKFWRLAGNSGYNAVVDRIHARLLEAGYADGHVAGKPSTWIEEYKGNGHSWDHTVGTLAIVRAGQPDEVVLSREKERLALCINSFSTPPTGIVAPLVDVGRGDRDEDFAGKDLKGAVVLGDADIGRLWQRAVMSGGAIGVISTALGSYVNPDTADSKTVTARAEWDILQWGSVPFDETRKGFGFKATPRAAVTLRRAISAGNVQVHVTIQSSFSDAPTRTLVAEIPGRSLPGERVNIAAHIQEPGANDNASGVATLAELATALVRNIAAKRMDPPERSITLMWLDETAGSRQWLRDHPDLVSGVRYMFSTDMPGEDVRKTGGAFLVERLPDPAAVWSRPWDPHTEWGAGNVRANQLKGDILNDLHLAICERIAQRSGWAVRSNPYEGGSDHTVYVSAGIPAVLDWHFTDRFYHTNFDTADKTSPDEMRNVAVGLTTSAWILASANEQQGLAVADLVSRTGQARIAFETREGAKLAAAAADTSAAKAREDLIIGAWRQWYDEAVHSTRRLVTGTATANFNSRLDALAAPFRGK
jgi:hypothetical protein